MREILFRGRRTDNDKWVEGFYLTSPEFDNIGIAVITADNPRHPHYVFKKTIGQYTGLTDKNGKKIFEGDIISHFIKYLGQRVEATVEYDNQFASYVCNYTFENKICNAFLCDWVDGDGVEIIGNIHDNPELLKESEDTE